MRALLQKIRKILRDRRTRRFLTRTISGFAAVVVFITTYALILPAITMEREASCGVEAHQHDDSCYKEVLICGLEETEDHTHTRECYEKVLVCGKEEHIHSVECYEEESSAVAASTGFAGDEETVTVFSGAAVQQNEDTDSGYFSDDIVEGSGDSFDDGSAEAEDALVDDYQDDQIDQVSTEEDGYNSALTEEVGSEGESAFDGSSDADFGEDGEEENTDMLTGSSEASEEANDGSAENYETESDSGRTEEDAVGAGKLEDELEAEDSDGMDGALDVDSSAGDSAEENDAEENGTGEEGDSDSAFNEGFVEDSGEDSVEDSVVDSIEDSVEDSDEDTISDRDQDLDSDYESDLNSTVDSDDETDNEENGDISGNTSEGASVDTSEDVSGETTSDIQGESPDEWNDSADGLSDEQSENNAQDATRDVLPEQTEAEDLSDGYVPELGEINFDAVLTKDTGIYYYHAEDGEEIPENSALIGPGSWKKYKEKGLLSKGTKLAPADLVRAYFAYTIPAGSLNETNQIARYRLPASLHLTDEQIMAINSTENGIAAGYSASGENESEDSLNSGYNNDLFTDSTSSENTDGSEDNDLAEDGEGLPEDSSLAEDGDALSADNSVAEEDSSLTEAPVNESQYEKYLGIEAIEGSRTPDENLKDGAVEYISAVVKAENIFDEETGEYLGQDLIFIFSPYTIEKNQIVYDQEGNPVSKGSKVSGWITLDYSMAQIDWVEEETDLDAATVEKTARVIFSAEDKENGVREISTDLVLAETGEAAGDESTVYTAVENAAADSTEAAAVDATDNAAASATAAEEAAADGATEAAAASETAAEDITSEKASEDATKDDSIADDMPSQTFEKTITVRMGSLSSDTDAADAADKNGALPSKTELTVRVSAEQGTFPAGTTMTVTPVTGDDLDAVASAVEGTVDARTRGFQAVDISFQDKDGKEIEPAKPIKVNMTSETIRQAVEDSSTAPVVVHVEDAASADREEGNNSEKNSKGDGNKNAGASIIESRHVSGSSLGSDDSTSNSSSSSESIDSKNGDLIKEDVKEEESGAADTISFEADSFSVYAIVYTVDFHWEVDGKEYEFNLPGGGFVSLEALVELMGVANKDAKDDSDSIKGEDPAGSGVEKIAVKGKLTLNGISVSEKTNAFVRDVEDVVFSNPELVWVGKTEEQTTVGSLKTANRLNVQYSADLTEEQIAQINAQTVGPEDWALISLLPFESNESLTVTMRDGERFVIRVTDEQIATDVLTADGETYKITVTFTEEAKIPAGTKLVAKEIEPGSDDYLKLLSRTWLEVNKEYLEQQERINQNDPLNDTAEIRPVNIDEVRFFDITFVRNGEELEPKAPVQVDIQLVKGLSNSADAPVTGVVHFPSEKRDENATEVVQSDGEDTDGEKPNEEQIELIEKVETVKDEDGALVEFSYEQESFSKVGVYLGQPTYDAGMEPMDPADALPKLTALGVGDGQEGLHPFVASKELNPNKNEETGQEDGTYTLSLSVKGEAIESKQITKANVLIMMDRSSSMTNGTAGTAVPYDGEYQPDTTFYGIGEDDHKLWPLQYTNGEWQLLRTGESPVTYTGQVYTASNRIEAEQAALNELVNALLSKNTSTTPDLIELCITSFSDTRGELNDGTNYINGHVKDTESWSGSTRWVTDTSSALSAVNSTYVQNGTNWQEALLYAKELADAKKAAQPDEDVYIIFLTDGEPTAIAGETAHQGYDGKWYGAYHYDPSTGDGSIYALDFAKRENNGRTRQRTESPTDPTTTPSYAQGWDSQSLVNDGVNSHKFYAIFTFNDSPTYSNYLQHFVNYTYGVADFNDDPSVKVDTPASDAFYTNATDVGVLRDSFDNIFTNIFDKLAYGDVKIVDGLSTDAMTTVPVNGQTDGIKYTVTDENGDTVYTVTATGPIDDPTDVVFMIGNTEYKLSENQVQKVTVTRTIKELIDDEVQEREYTGSYYTVKGPGYDYRMVLADLASEGTGPNEKRTLTWDLSPIGSLENGYTYTAEFIVWPEQEAYDYVAGLNNHLDGFVWVDPVIDETTGEVITPGGAGPVYDEDGTFLYYKFPSIVKDENGIFDVRTNTGQNVYYSEVYAQGSNDIVTSETTTPYEKPLDYPDPMPLTATNTYLEKEWSVDRNPARLAQYLYNMDGTSKEFVAAFDVFPGDSKVPYTTVYLGWDSDKEEYVWAEGSPIKEVRYGGFKHLIGTRWAQEFSIATGLMLSTERMDALGLDKRAYRSTTYTNDEGTTITYYILEPGHEYRIEEQEGLGYEFDFISPVFHPMLVDGALQNVTFDGFNEDAEPDEDPFDTPFSITSITDTPGGIGSLVVKNTLRGYINIEKKVVDKDGVTALLDDDTKFTYTIELHNDTDPGPFVGEDIPWYGINGLFYHEFDEQTNTYTYYQAEVTNTETNQSHTLELTTESGEVYEAWCTDAEGNEEFEGEDGPEFYIFDEDVPGPSYVTYNDGTRDVTIKLFGNEMTQMGEGDTNNVSAEFQITQSEILNLANIPSGTTYSIVEAPEEGYSLVSISKEIRNGDTLESRSTVTTGNGAIDGTIVPDRDNHIIYTNKIYSKDITVKKVDNKGNVLTGAVFTLTRTSGSGESEYDAGVSKPGDGEDDLGSYTFYGLADGSYSLTETAPPEGYAGISSPITFSVSGGVVSTPSNLPANVRWDGESATFTVTNQETNTGITVRKQWLDAGGNPDEPGAHDINVTLKRKVDQPTQKTLHITITINGRTVRKEATWNILNESAYVSWYDNRQFNYDNNRLHWQVDGPVTVTSRPDNNNPNNARFLVSGLQNASGNTVDITFTYSHSNSGDAVNQDWFADTIRDTTISISGTGNPVQFGGDPVEDDWSQSITLDADNNWSESFSNLPSADGSGNAYHYYIAEDVPEGYTVTYSDKNESGIQSGVLTAYNKATEIGSLGVNKLVEASNSALAGGNVHLANGKYNFTVSRVTSEDPYTTQIVKYVQIRINDGRTTYKVSGTEIPFDAPDTGFRWVYAEGAIVDNLIPGSYVVEETGYQLDNPVGYTMELKEIVVGGEGPNSTDLEGKKAILTVTKDSVVTATSSFTNLLVPEIDVPVLKGWNWSDEDEGNVESWSATFNLEYREVLVSGEGDPNANIHWTPVYEADGETQKSIIITSSSQDPKFEDLPMYKVHEDEDGNISVYRIIYAVDEVAYTVTLRNGDVRTWNKNESGHFEQYYSPTYDQDAGELDQPKDLDDWADWYTVKVTNSESTKEIRKTIDLSLEKTWENEPDKDLSEDPESYAKFKLMRYYHEESLDLTANSLDDPETSPLVTVKLVQDSETISELVIPKGAPVYIAGVAKAGETVALSFTDGRGTVSLNGGSGTSTRQQYLVSGSHFTADEGLVINLAGGETGPLVGGIYGLRLASFDGGDITNYQPDPSFNNQAAGMEFTLSAADGWSRSWVDLPQLVEEKTVGGDNVDHVVLKTIVYSYYLVETECHPEKYAAVFRDGLGNSRNPLIFSTPVAVENKVETTIVIRKIDEITRGDNSQKTLAGAYFRLLKYTGGTGGSYEGYDDYGVEGGVPVEDDGTLTFEDLPNGEYQIVEMVPPPGYVKIENNNIYINVTNGVVTRYDKPADDSSRQLIPSTVPVSDDPETLEPNVVAGISYVPDDDHAVAVFTVGNTPGVELPNSGGPGTWPLTVLGSILILGAGVLLWRRRRLI